jgi:hypothetical protein
MDSIAWHQINLGSLTSSPERHRQREEDNINVDHREIRWTSHVARMGEKRNAYSILVGKPEGKSPLGRPRRRWVNNIKFILERQDGKDWIDLAQDRDQ